MGLHYYDPSTLPRRHNIAWCRFPLDGSHEPGQKLRPTLVRATRCDTLSSRTAVVVSYGTSRLRQGQRGNIDLIIQYAAEVARLGLTMPTRFDLDRMQILPWAEEFFVPPPHHKEIVTGSLNGEQIARLAAKLRYRQDRDRPKPLTI
jgi:hypothetical protein